MTLPLDPELEAALATIPRLDFANLTQARALASQVNTPYTPPASLPVHLHTLTLDRPDAPPLDLRVFTPQDVEPPYAAIVHTHGGGFCMGRAEYDDAENYELAAATGAMVVSPEYRLAPEHPYPAALSDCVDALAWVRVQPTVNRERLAIMGHSAGGGLTAALALFDRDHRGPQPALRAQILLEPELDDRLATPSMRAGEDTPIWFRSNAKRSWQAYLGGLITDADRPSSRKNLTFSPAYAVPARTENLAGLPPTFLTVNAVDPLRDEGLEYARRLTQAGVLTEVHVWPGAYHGFTALRDTALARWANSLTTQAVTKYLQL